MAADSDETAARQRFDSLVVAIEQFHWRADVSVQTIAAPQRLAEYSYALEADLGRHDEELGSGRLVMLHDPLGSDAWQGTHRLVSLVRADTDFELVTDPLIGEVGWSWFTEALDERKARYRAPAGTVTVVSSRFFGDMNTEPDRAEVEIRTSWTPVLDATTDITAHLAAWQALICHVAGLPPLPEGISPLIPRPWQGPSRDLGDELNNE
ncbi:Protein of unknown function [Propionibacterium cyclohexanicum]|uniref:DUF3000 domain-containing protein n=1 Tax=Propionibacterium cyclohexanicum TaxID=64702 RepID=A0A1H9QNF3_9ACTN|nr:DUF3000 domain-containing protein [Propionibacterium cyclohexanicum]SER61982.1 Protein of unknown function [Propionibacterium cyclohexanicum]